MNKYTLIGMKMVNGKVENLLVFPYNSYTVMKLDQYELSRILLDYQFHVEFNCSKAVNRVLSSVTQISENGNSN